MANLTVLNARGLLKELLQHVLSPRELADALDVNEHAVLGWLENGHLPPPSLEKGLVAYCMHNNFKDLLFEYGGMSPSYNIYQEFDFRNTPWGYGVPIESELILKNRPTLIAGLKVNYPFGVSASVLMGTSSWIQFYAERGFDILTYKTVRTHAEAAHLFPNWTFIPDPKPLSGIKEAEPTQQGDLEYLPPTGATDITMANSFGVPSLLPEQWKKDIQRAKASLREGQILIVSVIGSTTKDNWTMEALADDYAKAAQWAEDAGADIIELNLSCPNIPDAPEGELYLFPDNSSQVSKKVKASLERAPLFIKIGYLESNLLTKVIEANAPYIDGVVAINTVSAPVQNKTGRDFFPPDPKKNIIRRQRAGISGSAIRNLAMELIRNLVSLKKKNNHTFDILAVGGVTTNQHVQEYLDLGATGVLSCTGAWANTNLAIETRLHTGKITDSRLVTFIGSSSAKESEEVKSIRPENSSQRDKNVSSHDEEVARILVEYDEAIGMLILLSRSKQATLDEITKTFAKQKMSTEKLNEVISSLVKVDLLHISEGHTFFLTEKGIDVSGKINRVVAKAKTR